MIDIRSIDLNLLKIFDALYAEKHVSRAAKRLHLTQPAVSMGLSRLRELTRDELFIRTAKAMIPTDRAQQLGPEINKVLAHIDVALNRSKTFDPKTVSADIRISVDDYLAQVQVMPVVMKAAVLAPRVRFEIVSLKDRDPNVPLQNELDFAIRAVQKVNPGLYVKRLATESFKVLCAQSNKRVGARLTLKTYTELEHIIASPFGGFNGIVDQVLAEKGLSRRVRFSVGHFSLGPLFLQNSEYLLTLPESIALIYEQQYMLRCLEAPIVLPSFHVNFYWHERVHQSPLHKWIRELFAQNEQPIPD